MLMVQSVVADINRRTGESECQYYKDRLLYTEDGQRDELIDRSRTLSCHGELKNNRGLVSSFQQCHTPLFFSFIRRRSRRRTFVLRAETSSNKKVTSKPPSLLLSFPPEASCVPLPGCPGDHQVCLCQRAACLLPALSPAHTHQAAGPGGPVGWRGESGRVHQRSLQQQ